MSQVHNKTLNYALQPLFLLTGTLLACRFIQHFPNTSRKALLLAGTVGTGAAFASSWKAPKYETSLHSSLRVIAWLALGIITTYALAKVLKGRVQLSLKGAALFAAIEAGEVTALAVTSKIVTEIESRDTADMELTTEIREREILVKKLGILSDAFQLRRFKRDFQNLSESQILGFDSTYLAKIWGQFNSEKVDFGDLSDLQKEWFNTAFIRDRLNTFL